MVHAARPAHQLGPEPLALHCPGDQEEMGGLEGSPQAGQDVEDRCLQAQTLPQQIGREESVKETSLVENTWIVYVLK